MSKTSTEQRSFSVGSVAVQIASSSKARRSIRIGSPSTGILYVTLGQIAVVGQGYVIPAGTNGLTLDDESCGDNLHNFISAILQPTPSLNPSANTDTPVTADSGLLAATAGNATLPGAAGQTTFITGFTITGGGATAGSVVRVTVTGLLGGTQGFNFGVPTGAAVGANPLVVEFPTPIPASGVNTAIIVNIPSFGAGNTAAEANATGFQRLTTAGPSTTTANVDVFDILECPCHTGGY